MTTSHPPRPLGRALRLGLLGAVLLILPAYLFEAYLAVQQPSKRGTVAALRADGIEAYPAVFPSGFVDLLSSGAESPVAIGGKQALPLAGVPDARTVYCYDSGGRVIDYRSDALGFRNPPAGGADGGGAPEIALLGGGFAQGHCVADGETLAARLRPAGPVASYGMDGAGPLAQLAIYREYVAPARPARVLWLFFEGDDIGSLARERGQPLLAAYRTPGHVQLLLEHQDELGTGLRSLVDRDIASPSIDILTREAGARRPLVAELKAGLVLARSRARLPGARALPTLPAKDQLPRLDEAARGDLRAIWSEVIGRQRAAGGSVTFAYLPAAARFALEDPSAYQDLESEIMGIWDALGADHVSLVPAIGGAADPLSLYSWQHFTADGYRLAADALLAHLEEEEKVAGSPEGFR